MKGYKTYRHEDNPEEKVFHDKFIEQFGTGITIDRIALPTGPRGEPDSLLNEHEQRIVITTIQWLGSPVGQSFLKDC